MQKAPDFKSGISSSIKKDYGIAQRKSLQPETLGVANQNAELNKQIF